MPVRNGVQYAATKVHRVPMHDDVGAEKVIEHIAAFYDRPVFGTCDCDPVARLMAEVRSGNTDAGLTHNPQCASNKPAPDWDPLKFARDLVEKGCGRYTRGAHKGKLRGWASIEVVTEGGWKRHGPGERNGGVVYPGRILGVTISDFTDKVLVEVGS